MKLQQKINELCLTITEIANRTETSRGTIHRILKGKPARNDTWAKLAKLFNCNINDIKE